MRSELFGAFLLFFNGFFFFHYFIQHCFTCRPSDSTVSTTALAVRRSNPSAGSDPNIILLFVLIRVYKKDLFCPQMAVRIKFGAQIMNQIWIRGFFLVRAAPLFTLRTFGAQINWRVISRKVLFDPQRFSSNKSPIHFAGESRKEIRFSMANGTFKMKMDINRHGPRLMPNNYKNLNPPYFSLPTTFNSKILM
jgi:hypothetical protein